MGSVCSRNKWQRRDTKLCLKSLCLEAVLIQIIPPINDIDRKQALRNYLHLNLPTDLATELHEFGLRKLMLSSRISIWLLEVLPKDSFSERVDLIGWSSGTVCCNTDNSLNWTYGVVFPLHLDPAECTLLHGALNEGDLTKLRSLALWSQFGALKHSGLPNIIARAACLTSLVIKGGADNHLLRIIGRNCHNLRLLDVSRSPGVTTLGLRKLFLVKPFYGIPETEVRTALAAKLDTFVVSVLGVTPEKTIGLLAEPNGLQELLRVSVYMDRAYVIPVCPDYMMSRIQGPTILSSLTWSPQTQFPDELAPCMSARDWDSLHGGIEVTSQSLGDFVLDFHERLGKRIQVCARNPESYLMLGLLVICPGYGVIELTVFSNTTDWNLSQFLDLESIVQHLPNLEKLEGRILGEWNGRMFPRLRTLKCWTLNDLTALSFLRHCPSLQNVDIKNLRGPGWNTTLLTHEELQVALGLNPDFKSSVEVLNIRPTSFNKDSVLLLQEECPKLRRIGDLFCWSVSEEEVDQLNSHLIQKNSPCTLIVYGFPPDTKAPILH